jgi:hypothetical protein
MNCLRISDVYDYIEGILSLERNRELERHLDVCTKCRGAVEDRKLIAGAASNLPPLAVPDDFTDRVMARVWPAKVKSPAWLIILASASSLLALTVVIMIASGRSVLEIISAASHSLWEYVKSAGLLLAKALTLLSLAGKAVRPLLESIAKGLSLANWLVSPALQFVLLGVMMALIISLAVAARKKISLGD